MPKEDTVSEVSDVSGKSEKSAYHPQIEGFTDFDRGEEKPVGEEGEGEEDKQKEYGALNFMSDQELIDYANELEVSIRYLEVENEIFWVFLEKYSPQALEGLEQKIMSATIAAIKRAPSGTTKINSKSSSDSSLTSLTRKKSSIVESMPSITNLIEGKGPKINLSTKTDMVTRTLEQAQAAHDDFIKKALRTKRNLKSELEEFVIRETDLKYARNQFEYNIVINGVEKLTGKIPAEKWLRYMDEWLRGSMLAMEKLRLRIAALKSQYKKLTKTYIQRKELGANVHTVDFDQLEIANKHLLIKIDQKQVHLVELKKMNGGANLVLSKHKKILLQQQIDFNKLRKDIEAKEQQIDELEEEFVKVEEERNIARSKFEYFKKFKSSHRVPDIVEYVVLKKEIDEINKNIKIWQRRKNIQEISLNASIREIKHITGSSVVDPAWIEDPVTDTEFEFNY
ncbi:unnamed protein product [Psylliodes chrysocephalus]|uniref:Cilia- and flagella-associated protein 263 n=1 Tax=Psylliodes chrysocephalus TaxID=3402493 RepID=A0A9P0GFK2_9CUCU|nr:unnamed protein product [Psylliodes chrysocephala]